MTARIALIAAVGRNGVIGIGGGLPWRVAADMRKFRAMTMGKPVIMGRKTFETLNKPLDGRTSIVVTRGRLPEHAGVIVAGGFDEALRLAAADLAVRDGEEIMIAGGGEIYAEAMPRADRLYVTHVDAAPQGDTRFPPIEERIWRETARQPLPRSDGDTATATFVTYERRHIGD